MKIPFMAHKGLVGLDIGSGAIKLVQLKKVGKGYRLVKFGVKLLDPELIVDGSIVDSGRVVSALKELIAEQGVKEKNVAFSVSGHSVIVKKVTLPAMTEDDLAEAIKWEAEQYIPFDINDVNIDFQILGPGTPDTPGGAEKMEVLLVAVKKDKITEYTNMVVEAGLQPVIVDVDVFSLENMYAANYDVTADEVVALVNIGASGTNMNILRGGAFSFTRDIAIGGDKCSEAIQRDFHLQYDEAERALRLETVKGVDTEAVRGIINHFNSEIATEVVRSLDYYKTTSNHDRIDRILISGGACKLSGLVEQMGEKTGVAVEVANPFKKIEIPEKGIDMNALREMGPLAAVSVGLAVRQIGDR